MDHFKLVKPTTHCQIPDFIHRRTLKRPVGSQAITQVMKILFSSISFFLRFITDYRFADPRITMALDFIWAEMGHCYSLFYAVYSGDIFGRGGGVSRSTGLGGHIFLPIFRSRLASIIVGLGVNLFTTKSLHVSELFSCDIHCVHCGYCS